MTTVPLASNQHVAYQLAEGLLLVFKPRGHHEAPHAHTHAQRLRVVRGRLRVETAATTVLLDAATDALTLAAGQWHATAAVTDTWLLAETVA